MNHQIDGKSFNKVCRQVLVLMLLDEELETYVIKSIYGVLFPFHCLE